MSCFFIPVHAASVPTFETGTVLEQPVKPIARSPFYLESKDGKTLLHDMKSKETVSIAYEGDLATYSSGGYDIASVDGQEFIAIRPNDVALRVTKRGDVTPLVFEEAFDRKNMRLLSYDAKRDVMVWRQTATYETIVTDLKGAQQWSLPPALRIDVILAASVDEVLTRTSRTLTRIDLKTGEIIATIPLRTEPDDVQAEPETDRIFFANGSNVLVYDIATQTFTTIEVKWDLLYSFTAPVYHDGKYYGFTHGDHLVEIDVAAKTVNEMRLWSNDDYVALQGGVVVQEKQRLLSLDRADMIPTNLTSVLNALEESGKGKLWIGESYQLGAIVRTSGGESFDVTVEALGADVVDASRTFADGYIIPSLDEPFSYKLKYAWLESKTSRITLTKKIPLTIETSFANGPVGEITGVTAPNRVVYLNCENPKFSECGGTFTSDETGRFTISRGIISGDQTLEIWTANAYEYYKATEASVIQTIDVPKLAEKSPATVLTNTGMEGVTIKTTPNARIEVRQLFSRTDFDVHEVQADASGIARLTTFNRDKSPFYTVFYRIVDTNSPYYLIHVSTDYPMPDVKWTKPPKTGDTAITVYYNGTLDPMLGVYKNGWSAAAKRLVPGTNVITLKEPLLEGQTIKIVASFRPELSQTFEQKVTSDAPKTLTVKDVLVTSSTSTFTILKDTPAFLNFIVDGKPISYSTVGKDRYRISVKPGTSVVIESSIGSKKKRTTHKVPTATFTSFAPTDEVNVWSGKTLPNATVTVKAGTKIVATTKASSTGTFQLKFARQRMDTKLSFEAKAGINREAKSATVKAGVRPTVTIGTIRAASKVIGVRTNVPYGTVYVYNGKTLVAKKTIVSTTTNVSIKPQKKNTKLTIKVVTPANRSGQTIKTVL